MEKVLYALGYLNDTEGFEFVFPDSVAKYRESDEGLVVILDMGIAGSPKYVIPYDVLDQWVEEQNGKLPAIESFDEPEIEEFLAEEDAVEIEIDEPDDLTSLPGVGPKLEQALNAAGITSFLDMVSCDREYLFAIPGMNAGKYAKIEAHLEEERNHD